MKKCSVQGCEEPHRAKGYCLTHYGRWNRTGTTDLPEERPLAKCKQDGCDILTQRESGYCIKHYKQQYYLKTVGREELLVRTSQERWIHSVNGYVMIKVDGKLVYEHRVLAEKALGKPLPNGVIVHHTKSPSDNHGYFDLVVCPNQDYHLLLHRRAQELGYENY